MSVFDSLLNHTFQVARMRRSPDGQGGWSIDYVEIDPVEGRLRPASSSEREEAQRMERRITHIWYVRAGEDVARGDVVSPGALVIDGARVSSTSGEIVVEIDAIREPSLAGHHLEIDCRERQLETSMIGGS